MEEALSKIRDSLSEYDRVVVLEDENEPPENWALGAYVIESGIVGDLPVCSVGNLEHLNTKTVLDENIESGQNVIIFAGKVERGKAIGRLLPMLRIGHNAKVDLVIVACSQNKAAEKKFRDEFHVELIELMQSDKDAIRELKRHRKAVVRTLQTKLEGLSTGEVPTEAKYEENTTLPAG